MVRMSGQERLEKVRDYVLAHGTVRTEELSTEFNVSLMTVHRDLERLAQEGWLRRVHGGASAERSVLFESNIRFRALENPDLKARVARLAADTVQPGQAVLLDDSTTGLAVARELLARGEPWTAITNANHVVHAIAGQPSVDLIVLGGLYHPSADACFGGNTVAMLSSLYADVAFMSTSAVTLGQCFHQVPDSIAIKRAMLTSAERSVLLIDHSKLSKHALHRFASVSEFDAVVVDDGIGAEELAGLRDCLDEVYVAADEVS
ncbi:MAG: DeoR/GlpR family DNA-binding transcription regulator [Bifidobacteriaceae bacterium]|jgi:DeoR/GlpR family transcriptional regulator of sugar metabolism|nr:DeoR/GlpR family DNA-binding transcription regulator [Bifidobacteriaceae bacterium]